MNFLQKKKFPKSFGKIVPKQFHQYNTHRFYQIAKQKASIPMLSLTKDPPADLGFRSKSTPEQVFI